MSKIIQFNKTTEFALECKCGFQLFFIVMDDNDDITHFECGREGCLEIIEFNAITLTQKDMDD